MPEIPPSLATTITGVYGDKGRAWVEAAPALIAAACEHWRLTLGPPFPNLSYNYAAPATLPDGTAAVLKAGVPSDAIACEIAALRQFTGHGGARLIDADPAAAVLLLERAQPGDTLDTLGDDEEETRIAARLMQQLWREPPPGHTFPTLDYLFQGLRRQRDRSGGGSGVIPAHLLELAEALVPPLLASSPSPVLLHGDFHHHNILRSGGGWLVIDPPGAVGDPAADPAMFFRNPHGRIAAMGELEPLFTRRLDVFAAELRFDLDRILRWATAWAVLSACWSVEDSSPDLDHGLRCATALASLLPTAD